MPATGLPCPFTSKRGLGNQPTAEARTEEPPYQRWAVWTLLERLVAAVGRGSTGVLARWVPEGRDERSTVVKSSILKLLRAVRRLLRAMFPRYMLAYEQSRTKDWSEIEEELLPIVVDRLRDAVDVGAYVGSYTFALAGLAHMVYAFEPDAELADLLRSAAPANVRVAHSAVSGMAGTSEFHVPLVDGRRAATCGSLVAPPFSNYKTRTVTTTTLDTALADADIGFIKIDVEGAEKLVLAGALQLIARCRPVILVEANLPDAVAIISGFFEPLKYAGFFVHEGKTFALDEFKPDMQDPQLLNESVEQRQKRWVNNFFFTPDGEEVKLREEIDRFLSSRPSRLCQCGVQHQARRCARSAGRSDRAARARSRCRGSRR